MNHIELAQSMRDELSKWQSEQPEHRQEQGRQAVESLDDHLQKIMSIPASRNVSLVDLMYNWKLKSYGEFAVDENRIAAFSAILPLLPNQRNPAIEESVQSTIEYMKKCMPSDFAQAQGYRSICKSLEGYGGDQIHQAESILRKEAFFAGSSDHIEQPELGQQSHAEVQGMNMALTAFADHYKQPRLGKSNDSSHSAMTV